MEIIISCLFISGLRSVITILAASRLTNPDQKVKRFDTTLDHSIYHFYRKMFRRWMTFAVSGARVVLSRPRPTSWHLHWTWRTKLVTHSKQSRNGRNARRDETLNQNDAEKDVRCFSSCVSAFSSLELICLTKHCFSGRKRRWFWRSKSID